MADIEGGREGNSIRRIGFIRLFGGLAAILAIPSFLLTLPPVQEKLFGNGPHVIIENPEQFQIYDGSKEISGLRVSIKDQDISDNSKEVVLLNFVFKNDGSSSLLPNYVSSSDPIGVNIGDAQIIELSRLSGSTKHLQDNVKASVVSQDQFELNQGWILDPDDEIRVDLIVLKDIGRELTLSPVGKIAGQKQLQVTGDSEETNLITSTFSGSFNSQILRFALYFIISVGLLCIVGYIEETYSKWKLSKLVSYGNRLKQRHAFAVEISDAEKEIIAATAIYLGDEKLQELIKSTDRFTKDFEDINIEVPIRVPGQDVHPKISDIVVFLSTHHKSLRPLNFLLRSFGITDQEGIYSRFHSALISFQESVYLSDKKFGPGFRNALFIFRKVRSEDFE